MHLLDALGVTGALRDVEVRDFPAVVTMDARGESLHARADAGSGAEGDPVHG